jgi:hypothetical protein
LDSGFDSLPTIHNVPDDPKPISPERALWLSVIARVWLDAFESSDYFLRASQTAEERRNFDPAISRGDARRWLTLKFDPWREDRETVCDLADLDPDTIRNAARRKLAALKADEIPTAEIVNLDRMFAKLVDAADGMDAMALDAALDALARLETEAA